VTPNEQRDVHEVYEISNKAFEDAIELLHLIEVMQAQNTDAVNAKLSAASAAGAALVVRNGLLSRIVLFLAGAYALSRPGDLHLQRAFDLLEQPAVRNELGLRGSTTLLDDATRLWAQCKGDPRLPKIKHFRNKFTAHLGRPNDDIALPTYDETFSFARDTMRVIDALARGTGARREPLSEWQPEAAHTAKQFWSAFTGTP
jgi:AbiU2